MNRLILTVVGCKQGCFFVIQSDFTARCSYVKSSDNHSLTLNAYNIIAGIDVKGLFKCILNVTVGNGGVMLKAAARKADKLILKIIYLGNAATTEKFLFNGVIGKFTLTEINGNLAVLGLVVLKGHRERRDSSLVSTPTAAGVALVKHFVRGYRSL